MLPLSIKPKVFISSTIYDFADIRSALKYWLEELGYEVYASEFNDFPKDLNDNSYNACLETLRQSDYFILLIGGRAGGWYDKESQTTITMQEYRCAYELAKKGSLKIATLVRSNVWDAREDRAALRRVLRDEYASEHNLTPEDIETITHHRSKAVSNADVIFKFLNEVARNAEMKDAINGQGALPPANWIHQFSSFRDIIDALKGTFITSQGIRKAILGENLRMEILDHLRTAFFMRVNKNSPATPLLSLCHAARMNFSGSFNEASTYKGKEFTSAIFFVQFSSQLLTLHTNALDSAIDSGEFLDFDVATNKHCTNDFHKALLALLNELSKAKKLHREFPEGHLSTLLSCVHKKQSTTIPNNETANIFSLYDRHKNILALSTYIIKTLDNSPTTYPALCPISPYADQIEEIKAEALSDEEILAWINSPRGN